MITDLKDFNDGLYTILSSVQRRMLRHALAPELLDTDQVADLQALREASTDDNTLTNLVNMRSELVQIENLESSIPEWLSQSSQFHSDIQIAGKAIVFDQLSANVPRFQERSFATYFRSDKTKDLVIVEWKSYDVDFGDKIRDEQRARLNTLARLLHIATRPPELRVPLCLGYVLDDFHPRIGFVFQHPIPQSSPHMHHLYDSLGQKKNPFLGYRFKLAYELSLTVLLLHTAGWLHKGNLARNIVFFENAESTATIPKEVYLMGFEFSRPNTLTAYSDTMDLATNMTRHPLTQGPARQRFSRCFDIYALGIVLLEIGFWRRIEEFWHKSYTPETFRQDLCSFHTPKLGSKVGEIYMKIVSMCLGDKFEKLEDSELQKEYYWTVVHELSRLVA
jgi:hypothetical protein